MSEPLLGGEVVNRVDQPPALREFLHLVGGAQNLEQPASQPTCQRDYAGARAENAVKPVDLSDK